jgi:hypothetical protein
MVPEEDELPESLPGFDLGAGLERLMGNKRLYRKLLVDFGTKYIETASDIRNSAEMGDVMTLTALAEELKANSDTCIPLSKQIIQMAEDFEFDGILKLADALDAC